MGDKSLHLDIKKIQDEAKQSIRQGAVTKDYPLDLNQVHHYLNVALATEIMCVMRYRHHQIISKGIDKKEVAEEFEEHAKEEEQHMLMIAERINQLGGNPNFDPSTYVEHAITQYGSATSLIDMIKDDLIAERIVISAYREMIEWFGVHDSTTRIMLEKILKDEEEHANDLADLLHSNTEK